MYLHILQVVSHVMLHYLVNMTSNILLCSKRFLCLGQTFIS